MFHRSFRVLPALVAAVAAAVVASGSFALASGFDHRQGGHHQGDYHRGGHHYQGGHHHPGGASKRCDRHCRGMSYSAWDEQWLTMSIQGDLFEIQGGKIALQKATTPQVKTLASTLITDHTKSLADSVEVAHELGIEVPDSPSPSQQWELQVVSTFSGNAFDRWYSSLEVKDHIQDIQEAKDEEDQGCNDDVQALAEDDIPVLEKHLHLAEAALTAAGGPPTS